MKNLIVVVSLLFTVNAQAQVTMVQTVAGPRATGYLGWPSEAARLKAPYKGIEVNDTWIPKSFSWRGSGVLPPIHNQGQCGSCYSEAITGSLEIAVNVQGFRPTPNLSVQQIVSCDQGSYGCSGGFMSTAQFVVDYGLTNEENFPYRAANVACKKNLPIAEKAISYHLLGSANTKPSVVEIKAAILRYGSVFVTVAAGGPSWSGNSDRITGCRNSQENHMVILTGWSAKNEWEMRNSWGKEFGDGGYAWVPFGCDKIASEAGYIVVE